MSACAESVIKTWRIEAKMTAGKLADAVGCDVTTIYRYEQGKLKPSPDVMYQICKSLGDLSYWCDWMGQEYPGSYARIHPKVPNLDTAGIILSLYSGTMDLESLKSDVFHWVADGKTLDDETVSRLKETLIKLSGFSQALLNKLLLNEYV